MTKSAKVESERSLRPCEQALISTMTVVVRTYRASAFSKSSETAESASS